MVRTADSGSVCRKFKLRSWTTRSPDSPSCRPRHPLVQRVASACSDAFSPRSRPAEHTAPPPRPDLGHGTNQSVTPRHPRRRRRPQPLPAAPGNPPASEPPKTAPSPPEPARSRTDHGSPPAPGAFPNISDRPRPRSRTPATCSDRRTKRCGPNIGHGASGARCASATTAFGANCAASSRCGGGCAVTEGGCQHRLHGITVNHPRDFLRTVRVGARAR